MLPGGSGRCPPAPPSGLTGTTEKIFEEKRELYDVYVDNQNVRTHHEHLQPLLKVNGADREKYRRLNEQRWGPALGAHPDTSPGGDARAGPRSPHPVHPPLRARGGPGRRGAPGTGPR